MTTIPYTQKRFNQFRGPDSSEDYNARVEENYKDLVSLLNTNNQLASDLKTGLVVSAKDIMGLAQAITSLNARCAALETSPNTINFVANTQIDTDKFNATAYNVATVDRLSYNSNYNFTTLPLVPTSSMSKIKFTNNDGTYNVPPSLEAVVAQIVPSADDTNAVIDTTQPLAAIAGKAGKVWERNLIRSGPDLTNGAQAYLYIKIPNDLSAVANSNAISFNPYPLNTVDIVEIAYSTDINVNLGASTAKWTPFNSDQIYYQAPGAAGNIIPGGWTGDTIFDSGPKMFYFDPKPIAAIRIKLRQDNYFTESSKTVYSYGMSKLDIRYDKFLDTGKALIRFDAPGVKTISKITSITPQMWNIPEYMINDVFSYRVIWETSFNSGTYTLSPVALSKRVWVEVTLRATPSGGTPQLSGLLLKYT